MKYLFSFLIGLILLSTLNAQTKYFIYFKDKGVSPSTKLEKTSSLYKLAEEELSSKAIERRKAVMGDNYITYEDLPLNDGYVDQIKSLGVKIENLLKWFNAVTSYLSAEQINQIRNLPFVQKVVPVGIFYFDSNESNVPFQPQPTNSLKKSSYSLDYGASLTQDTLSDIPTVHDLGITGAGVTIGLLDSGFRWKTHPAFNQIKILKEYDFVQHDSVTANQTGDSGDQDSHGTSVLSIIGGFAPGYLIGPAFNANYILAKTEYVPTETHVEEDNYAVALEWMEGLGVDITSSSLGYSEFDPGQTSYTYADMNGQTTIVAKAANLAFDRGVTTFSAAGNEGNNAWHYIVSPGDAPNMITVGAVDRNNLLASFSSRGPTSDGRIKPEVCAMGISDVSARAGTTIYSTGSGTSFATPIAAGVGALLKSVYPHLTNRQIRKTFIECGDRVSSPDNNYGYGLISAARVVAFPNLSSNNNIFNLNKIFINANGVNSQTVVLKYKIGNGSAQSVSMNYDGKIKYNYSLPLATSGDSVKFYFQYQTNSSAIVREPSVGAYVFTYGDLLISYDPKKTIVEQVPTDYSLVQNYPNPFNLGTRIEFYSPVNSQADVRIYNSLGQSVRTLFAGQAVSGKNSLLWDGRNDNGQVVASGPYFYVLKIQGNILTKKMILLK
ncbi:MAG: S8 family serine peptidase [Bacteroidetes bacterium]|nr:S8 family serine peptidase [Bacteroidota bacterium]